MDATQIDWAQATVDGGQLTAPLTGEATKKWTARVDAVLERLHPGGSHWGAIKVSKKKVTVDGVSAGSEADLRHLLESAVLQANADVAAAEEHDDEDDRSDEDQQMTDAFRAFAPAEKTEDG